MAICKLDNNMKRSNSCGYSLPEIVDVYLINYEDISGTAISGEGGAEEITAITLNASANTYHIEPAKGSASFEDTLVVEDAGNKYRHAAVTFNVPGKYDAKMHANLDALSLGRYFAVVKTADGNYLGFGRISPIEAETATLAGGSENNGTQVVLSGNIAESPLPLSDACVTALLATVKQDN